MDILGPLLDFILHVDVHLANFVNEYGAWVYALLFAIIFVETGVVVMPFLPGDSLLFVVGTMFGAKFLIEFVLQFQGVPDSVAYWAGIGGYVLSGPYVALVRLFDYVDARTRREGWDIQVRFNAIAQKSREERANSLAA